VTRGNHRKEWTQFVEQREAAHKKKRPKKKEPSPQERADDERALDDLTRETTATSTPSATTSTPVTNKLKLPRDRELIRQLAFVRVSQGERP
jgi:hypothetical protein